MVREGCRGLEGVGSLATMGNSRSKISVLDSRSCAGELGFLLGGHNRRGAGGGETEAQESLGSRLEQFNR